MGAERAASPVTAAAPRVVRVGARSPLGLSAPQVALCARARKLEPRATGLVDALRDPVGMVRARFLPDDLFGFGRLVALAAPALAEAAVGLRQAAPVIVAVPGPERPDWDDRYGGALVEALGRASGVAVDLASSSVVAAGHAGFAVALEAAWQALDGGAPLVIVGAVDSFYHPEVLAWLDGTARLHTRQREGGVQPSEGAGFVVLARPAMAPEGKRFAEAYDAPPPPVVAALRWLRTVPGAELEAPEQLDAMTSLVGEAGADLGRPFEWVRTDVNGEQDRIDRWTTVMMRCRDELEDAQQERLPVQLGDVGAASGALALVTACCLWERGGGAAPSLLVALHGDLGDRALFVAEQEATGQGDPARISIGVPTLHAAPRAESTGPASEGSAAEQDHLLWMARDCLSDLTSFWSFRRARPGQPWHVAESFEQRLLDSLDGLVALGQSSPAGPATRFEVRDALRSYVGESRVPDRGRLFATALVRCSLDDDAAVEAAVADLGEAPASTHRALGAALSLAPNPSVSDRVIELLDPERPELAAVAMEVARFRRVLPIDAIAPWVRHADPSLRRAAARALGTVADQERAARQLEPLQTDRDEDVALEAWASLSRQGSKSALDHAREQLAARSALSDAARLGHLRSLALAGDGSDVELLRRCARATVRDAELVGWFGHVELVGWLIERLTGGVDGDAPTELGLVPHAAAMAFVRITGAPGPDGQPPGNLDGLSEDPARWIDWWVEGWQEHRDQYDSSLKWRFGRPYEPALTLAELAGDMPCGLRDDGALELAMVLGPSRFEPGDWVARQRQVFEELQLRLNVREAPHPPGTWPAMTLR